MEKQPLAVYSQGMISRDLLEDSRHAVITGTTSRGVFIRLDSDWILFLSFERFHGPLTLNLSGGTTTLSSLDVNDRIVILGEKILIPSPGIEIDFSQAETWEAPPLSDVLLAASERVGSLKTTATYILSQRREPDLYLVLKELLELELDGLPLPPRPFEGMDFVRLLQLLKSSAAAEIYTTLAPLLGAGTGLTPAGDDLIQGLLLAYRRWGTVLKPAFDLNELAVLINQAASHKTTLLSANLIACASLGQADERLLSALDGIMTGNLAPEQCASALMSWGNSSGRDALVGMALAVLSAAG